MPQQDGYFIGDKAVQNIEYKPDATKKSQPDVFGQEAETFDSTVVPFMQNKVTDINICLISPTTGNGVSNISWGNINKVLKVVEVDILLKESSTNNVYVVETLGISDFGENTSKYLFYNYQSKKPWRVLPTDQVTRVSDVVPLRALAQEISGNRVIYGNYVEKNASPERLNYHLSVGQKSFLPDRYSTGSEKLDNGQYARKEYQNHTLKQNRTYQVGVVLSDRYGRKSNVILSELIDQDATGKKNSTIFHNYANSNNLIIYDNEQFVGEDASTWPGDNLSIIWTNLIPQEPTPDGYPGVYSVNDGTLQSILINESQTATFPANSTCTFDVVDTLAGPPNATASVKAFSDANQVVTSEVRSSTNGWVDGMNVLVDWSSATGFCPGWLNEDFTGNAVCPADRPLGWYSYNIVVKQTEQEYYNVYMPSALAGYPCNQNPTGKVDATFGETPKLIYPVGQENTTSHLTLFGDNINKVPRDLNEVGPEQNTFRSSERLFHRVEGILLQDNSNDIQYSSQPYSPAATGDKVVTISNMSKLDLGNLITNPAYPILPNLIYKANTDPFIARVSTSKKFGIAADTSINGCVTTEEKLSTDGQDVLISVQNTEFAVGPVLSISETKPVESLLDIFWETSTSGLISDLNNSIENDDNTAPAGLSPVSISWSEGDPYGANISGQFSAVSSTGLVLGVDSTIELVSVFRGDNVPCIDQFELVDLGFGEYELKIAPASATNPGFLHWKDQQKNEYNFRFKIIRTSTGSEAFTQATGYLSNKPPVERLQTVDGTDINWVDVKEAVCSRSQLNTQQSREDAQTMSLKASAGSQKHGISWTTNQSVKWRSYVEKEETFANTPVNFGPIGPTNAKYINAAPFTFKDDSNIGSNPCAIDTNMDNGDIRQSGLFDFGWFGGPTLSGTQGQKNGDNKFFNTNYNPGNDKLNSCSYSQKIYAPDPSYYPPAQAISGNGVPVYYPVNAGSGDFREMPKYFRGATSLGGQPDIKWDSTILEETSFSKNINGSEWDGTFSATNGEFGSETSETWPNINGSPSGIGTSLEIEWSIPRMYQVSMMIPHGSYIPNQSEDNIMKCFSFGNEVTKFAFDIPEIWEMPSRTSVCFGLAGISSGSKYFDVQPAGEVIFGLIPEDTILNLQPNRRNSILRYLPKGPIYWDNNSGSGRAGFQGSSQLDPENRVGESIVGAKQNSYSDSTGLAYAHHYWPDINGLLQNDAAYAAFRNTNTASDAPDFMKLRDGANTFYQFNTEHSRFVSEWICGKSDTSSGFPCFSSAAKNVGQWNAAQIGQINALGHLFYLGGIQGGIGSSTNGQTFFVNPEQIQPGFTKSKAKIHAGPPNGTSNDWSGPNAFGQGMPGGRYVVTLRATDVGGDGAFVEWDVPIYLPWWSTRTNTPLRTNNP